MMLSRILIAILLASGCLMLADYASRSGWGRMGRTDAGSVAAEVSARLTAIHTEVERGTPPASSDLRYIVFHNGNVKRWSPGINFPIPGIQSKDTLLVLFSPAGIFIQDWWKMASGDRAVGLIPLTRVFLTPEGKPLHTHDEGIFGREVPRIQPPGMGQPVQVGGQVLFSLAGELSNTGNAGWPVWFLIGLAIAILVRVIWGIQDRKSTRLNSSH